DIVVNHQVVIGVQDALNALENDLLIFGDIGIHALDDYSFGVNQWLAERFQPVLAQRVTSGNDVCDDIGNAKFDGDFHGAIKTDDLCLHAVLGQVVTHNIWVRSREDRKSVVEGKSVVVVRCRGM